MPPPPTKKFRPSTPEEPIVDYDSIPDEIWLIVLELLPHQSLSRLALTCSRFNILAKDPELWKHLHLDWQALKHHPQRVGDVISRAVKLESITLNNKTFEQIISPVVGSTLRKAGNTLTKLVLSPEVVLSNDGVTRLGGLTSLTHIELPGDWIKSSAATALSKLTQLQSLQMPGSEQVTPKDLKDLFCRLTNLRVVDISDCKKGVTDTSIIALAENNPHLEYLAVDECEMLTGKSMKIVAEKCPRLQHLSLDGCYQVSDPGVVKIAANCPDLTYLSLGLCSTVKDSSLKLLASNCSKLSYLSLFGCSYISERGISKLLEGCQNSLKFLCIRGMIGVSQTFSEKITKQYPDIQIIHQFQPKPKRDRAKKY